MAHVRIGVLIVLVSCSIATASTPTVCPGVSVDVDRSTTSPSARLDLRWSHSIDDCTYDTAAGRITERMPVTVHVDDFNFLRYGLRVEIEEEVVEAYAELVDFWTKLLDIGTYVDESRKGLPCDVDVILGDLERSLPGCAARATDFDSATVAWRKKLREAASWTAAELAEHPALHVDDDGKRAIAAMRAQSVGVVTIVDAYRDVAYRFAASNRQLDVFERYEADHDRLVAGIRGLQARADLVARGLDHAIRKKEPGTMVTVRLTPQTADGVALPQHEVELRYFVHSRFPLSFHAGLAYSDVDEVEFRTVRTAAGEDLFSKILDDDGDLGLSAFLSYRLWSYGPRADRGLSLTVGTDVDDPGERAYLGLSHAWGRWVLTGGWARVETEEGGEATADPDLFRTIREGSEDGGFLALSFTVLGIR